MKKIFKKIILAVCATATLLGAASCGKSAYDVAVKNGYKGTEQEWLQTLQGNDGKDGQDLTAKDLYETAKANGFEGTFIEFCSEVLKIEVQEDNDVDTIANNITSVVSIYCGFSRTTQTGGVMIGGMIMGGQTQKTFHSSAGAGVIIDLDKEKGDALIVTNYHVIYDTSSDQTNGISDSIYLYTYGALMGFTGDKRNGFRDEGGDGLKATFVGGAMDYDVALLRVTDSDFLKNAVVSAAKIGNSDKISVGEKVFAIGNPDGGGIAVTDGIISVESEYIVMGSTNENSQSSVDYRVMRTDAAINSGNSGGGLFNTEGELIGITNAKNASSEVDNMGYALPISQVKALCDNLLRCEKTYGDGKARVARFGITVTIAGSSAYFDESGKLCVREKFRIYEVNYGGAAYGKMQALDEIHAFRIGEGEWKELTRQHQLIDALLGVSLGDTVQVRVTDKEGNEQIRTVKFDKNSYFVVYN